MLSGFGSDSSHFAASRRVVFGFFSMLRYQAAAGQYAPLRVVLYEDNGGSIIAYDLPSDLFGQFGDERVTKVGRQLDLELESALEKALSL